MPDAKERFDGIYRKHDPVKLRKIGRDFLAGNAATVARRTVDRTRLIVWGLVLALVLFFVISIAYIFHCAAASGTEFAKVRDETVRELFALP
jgi:hypothetical protein